MYRTVCVFVFRLLCAVLAYADAVDWIVVISHSGRKLLVIGMQVHDVVTTCYTESAEVISDECQHLAPVFATP